jgi:thiol-disulfide isomerase/thioredoxin
MESCLVKIVCCSIFAIMSCFSGRLGATEAANTVPMDQGRQNNVAADIAWAKLGVSRTGIFDYAGKRFEGLTVFEAQKKWDTQSFLFNCWSERVWQDLRTSGLAFWETYPDDPRRFLWLSATVINPPKYFKDIKQGAQAWADGTPELADLESDAIDTWKRKYITLRANYLAVPQPADPKFGTLRLYEMYQKIGAYLPHESVRKLNFDLPTLSNEVLDMQDRESATVLSWSLFEAMDNDPALQSSLTEAMKLSSYPRLQQKAACQERILGLRRNPMQMEWTALNGSKINLAQLHGKVVLLDFWSLTCSSCIESMMRTKPVYARLHDKGLEIIGLVFEDEKSLPKINALLTKIGVSWPQSLQGGVTLDKGTSLNMSANEVRSEDYACWGFPVTLLLDQNGLLVTDDVSGPKLQREVSRLLGVSVDEKLK